MSKLFSFSFTHRIRAHNAYAVRKTARRSVLLVCSSCAGLASAFCRLRRLRVSPRSIVTVKKGRGSRQFFLISFGQPRVDRSLLDRRVSLLSLSFFLTREHVVRRRLLIRARACVSRWSNNPATCNHRPIICFAYVREPNPRAPISSRVVHADKYAYRLGRNLHANYYASHYRRLSRGISDA